MPDHDAEAAAVRAGVPLRTDSSIRYSPEWWERRHALNERSRTKNMLRQRAKATVVRRHQEEYEEELALLILAEEQMWGGPR